MNNNYMGNMLDELNEDNLEEVVGGIKIGGTHVGFLSGIYSGRKAFKSGDVGDRTNANTGALYKFGYLLSSGISLYNKS